MQVTCFLKHLQAQVLGVSLSLEAVVHNLIPYYFTVAYNLLYMYMLPTACKYIPFHTIATKTGIQLKPASTMQSGQQKRATVPLRPQASHTVQLVSVQHPNSQQGIPRRLLQQMQCVEAQEAVKQQDFVHLKPQQSRNTKQQDHPSPAPRKKAVGRPVQQGAERTNSRQPQCTLSSNASAVIRSKMFQPIASPQYDYHFPVSF